MLGDHVLDLAEGLQLLLREPLLIKLVLCLTSLRELVRGWVVYQVWVLLVRVEDCQGRDRVNVEFVY